jgi:hypothetical protein
MRSPRALAIQSARHAEFNRICGKKEHPPAILVFATSQVEALSIQREAPTTRPLTNTSSGGISLVMEMVYAGPAPVELPEEVTDMPLVMGALGRQVAIWNRVCLWAGGLNPERSTN